MAQREILLEKMFKVLQDIETNTCDKEFLPNTTLLEKKLDRIIELHEQHLLILSSFELPAKKKKKQKDKKDDIGKKKTGKRKN
jgi:hypothetical protein